MRLTALFLSGLLSGPFLLAGCSNQSSAGEVVEITSAAMTSLDELPLNDSSLRVVAVGNGVAEILVALGMKEIVVGRDIASEIEELSKIPIVTNGHDLSAEKVLTQRPDLMIVDPNTAPRSSIKQVEKAGVRVVEVPESFTLAGISEKIDLIASALGEEDRGSELTSLLETEIGDIEKGSARILFLYLRGGNGIFLVGGKGSGADAMIEAAGGIDLGSTLYENPFSPINSEAIQSLDPDHYLLMTAGLESVGGIAGFRKLPGIDPSIPVITVDDSLLLSFGARTPDLIKKLNRAIYG